MIGVMILQPLLTMTKIFTLKIFRYRAVPKRCIFSINSFATRKNVFSLYPKFIRGTGYPLLSWSGATSFAYSSSQRWKQNSNWSVFIHQQLHQVKLTASLWMEIGDGVTILCFGSDMHKTDWIGNESKAKQNGESQAGLVGTNQLVQGPSCAPPVPQQRAPVSVALGTRSRHLLLLLGRQVRAVMAGGDGRAGGGLVETWWSRQGGEEGSSQDGREEVEFFSLLGPSAGFFFLLDRWFFFRIFSLFNVLTISKMRLSIVSHVWG